MVEFYIVSLEAIYNDWDKFKALRRPRPRASDIIPGAGASPKIGVFLTIIKCIPIIINLVLPSVLFSFTSNRGEVRIIILIKVLVQLFIPIHNIYYPTL